ncbi:hypothetical protein MMC07_002994 [Pseudocyphellaria aurata]|nr:hypothetical protein [Pseudocyphellaria aurata]
MSVKREANPPPSHPPPPLGHDLGIMFGFMALFLISMGVYLVVWKAGNRRSEARETARREALGQRGIGGEKLGLSDVGGRAAPERE